MRTSRPVGPSTTPPLAKARTRPAENAAPSAKPKADPTAPVSPPNSPEKPPVSALVTGRTAYSLSAFGEHLIGEEIEEAVAAAASSIGAMVSDYAVGAMFPEGPGDLGGHLYIVEFAGAAPPEAAIAAFAASVDRHLAAKNEDYAAHRSGGQRRDCAAAPG